MKIQQDQLRQLAGANEQILLTSIGAKIRKDYHHLIDGVPDDLLQQMITLGTSRARSFGISAAPDICGFVYIMFEVGPGFFHHPEINAILTSSAIPPSQKLSSVVERTKPQCWEEVVATLHRHTWFPEASGRE